MIGRPATIGWVVLGFAALAAMRWSTPSYDAITGPIPFAGPPGTPVASDNLMAAAGSPQLARTLVFRANGFATTRRTTSGVWLLVPVRSRVTRDTGMVRGELWEARDGRRFSASRRVETAGPVLAGKFLQPGLDRKNLVIFELPKDAVAGGALLLSEDAYPQLTGEVRIAFPDGAIPTPAAVADLDRFDARL